MSEKRKVEQFRSLTRASPKQAKSMLRSSGGDVSAAVEEWFSKGMVPEDGRKGTDVSKAEAEFDRFVDAEEGVIVLEGLVRLCEELGVDPESDPTILLVLHYMNAPSTDNVSREAFIRGMQAIGVSTVSELKARLPALQKELSEMSGLLASFWASAYRLNTPDGMRVISGETATALLELVGRDEWPLLPEMVAFLQEHTPRTVTRDTWNQIRQLMQTVKADLSDFPEESAWPTLIDEFVEWKKAKDAHSGGAGGGGGAV